MAGYIIATGDVRRIWRKVILGGWWAVPSCRWLAGRYGLGAATVFRVLRNKLFFLSSERGRREEGGQARILSLAVEPSLQGRGVGGRLLEAGLASLSSRGASSITLEVRPDNERARRLYGRRGFGERGSFRDLQGAWLILEKKM